MKLINRMRTHFQLLSKGRHANCRLQRAYNLHGGNNFYFKIIETFDEISIENLLAVENKYLFECKENKLENYNLNYEASGSDLSDESKKKISEKRKSNHEWNSKVVKHLLKINQSRIGTHLTDEHKEKLRIGSTGIEKSDETRRLLSLKLKGLKRTPEQIENNRRAHIGIPQLKNRNPKIYDLVNVKSGQLMSDTTLNLRKNYKIIMSTLIRRGIYKGWKLKNP